MNETDRAEPIATTVATSQQRCRLGTAEGPAPDSLTEQELIDLLKKLASAEASEYPAILRNVRRAELVEQSGGAS